MHRSHAARLLGSEDLQRAIAGRRALPNETPRAPSDAPDAPARPMTMLDVVALQLDGTMTALEAVLQQVETIRATVAALQHRPRVEPPDPDDAPPATFGRRATPDDPEADHG